ncbi:CLC_0170 family protein [Paenibacillus thermotolerans]|uniref:CLC_0170 family protein n=1 Tax=Paenibacillus thermotolerans TaxID=3027807 RepID=UPI002368A091|nr:MULTISPECIES: CLC_0170 family protein [unclassified Paenibacillus]
MINSFIGHIDYIIFMLLFTGAGILFIDEKKYRKNQMKKEEKASRFFGWINVALGMTALVLNWLFGF